MAQTTLSREQEVAAQDTSQWVHFPPKPVSAIPAPFVPAPHPQPSAPIQAPGTTVDSRGWLIYNNPNTTRSVPKTTGPAPSTSPMPTPAAAASPPTSPAANPTPSQPDAAEVKPVAATPVTVEVKPEVSPVETPPMAAAAPLPAAQVAPEPVAKTEPPPPQETGPTIKRFEFSGNTVYSQDTLNARLASWLGRKIEIPTLERAVESVSTLYRQDGWLVKVELPSQDLTDGHVKIRIIEAVLSDIEVQLSPHAAITQDKPKEYVAAATPVNEPLSLKQLERASQLINELPGVQSSISLRPGKSEGQTEAVVSVADGKPHDASLLLDNAGSRSTGTLRATGQVSLKGNWQRGDLTTMQWTATEGLKSLRLSYSEPVGSSGLRAGLFASGSNYRLILPEYSSINPHGPAQSLGVEVMYPWLRTATSSINGTGSLENKRFINRTLTSVSSDYGARVFSVGLNGQFQDAWNGMNSASIQLNRGYLDLSGSPNESDDAATARTAGLFSKTRLQWVRQQKLTEVDAFQVGWQGQWANKNMDGSEKLFLGGPQGVRAYPVNEAGASAGHVVNLEWFRQLQWTQEQPWVLSVFKDTGYATVNKYTWGPETLNRYTLGGHGLSLATNVPSSLGQSQLKFTWARRLGLSPIRNSNGLDQDGSLIINRFWMTLSHYF